MRFPAFIPLIAQLSFLILILFELQLTFYDRPLGSLRVDILIIGFKKNKQVASIVKLNNQTIKAILYSNLKRTEQLKHVSKPWYV